jgi:Phage integrase, N-terminal SAM-like domain
MDFAEDWYLGLRGRARNDELKVGKKFREAAKHFLSEYLILIQGERNERYVKGYETKLRVHLLPFFGDKVLSEVTPGLVQQYRVHRAQQISHLKRPPSRSTLHSETVVLRASAQGGQPAGLAVPCAGPVAALQNVRQDHASRLVLAVRIQDAV